MLQTRTSPAIAGVVVVVVVLVRVVVVAVVVDSGAHMALSGQHSVGVPGSCREPTGHPVVVVGAVVVGVVVAEAGVETVVNRTNFATTREGRRSRTAQKLCVVVQPPVHRLKPQ